ncbi:GAF domain-containing SpoIIE family protein phosphatase [candidate division KSB1 bacterium]
MKNFVSKILFNTVFIGILSGLLYLVFLITGIFLTEKDPGFYLLFFIFSSVLLYYFIKPVIAHFQNFRDTILYPEQKKLEAEVDELSKKIIRSIKYNEIFDLFFQGFSDLIKSKNIFIYYSPHNNIIVPENDEKVTQELLQLLKNENDSLLKALKNVKDIKIFDIVEFRKLSSTLRDVMLLLQVRSIITLVDKDEVIGWIAIGGIKRKNLNPRRINELFIKLSDKFIQAIEHAGLYQEAKRESVEKGILIEVVKKMSTSRDLEEILSLIIDYLGEIVPYDAAGIFLIDKESKRNLTYNVLRGYDEKNFEGISLKVGKGFIGWSVKYGRGEITGDVLKDDRYIKVREETRSQMVIPIKMGKDVIGSFCLESNKLNFFTQNHYEVAKTFVSQAAVAIENAQLYFEYQKKEKMEEELKVARDIQSALLPEKVPHIRGYDVAVFHQYSRELGGDLHIVRELDNTRVSIAIGDAAGKGIPGAILMSALYGLFRPARYKTMDVNETIHRLNDSVVEFTRPDSYATFFYGILKAENGEFVYTNAGHNPPFLIKKSGETVHLDVGGTVLGFFRDIEYKSDTVTLEDDDMLCLYTDGVTECNNKWNDEFGEKRLLDVLVSNRHLSAEKIKKKVIDKLHVFGEKGVFDDDVTIVIVKKGQDNKKNEKT